MHRPHPVRAALLLVFASACGPSLNEQLVGTYLPNMGMGMACDAITLGGNPYYVAAEASFSTTSYDTLVTYYSDSACTAATLTYEQQGAYTLGSASAVIDGATEVTYGVTVRLLTPRTDASTTSLNALPSCGATTAGGWVRDIRRDVTQTGCTGLVASCPTEYDILKLDSPLLYVGKKSGVGTNCTTQGRPITLGQPLQLKQ
jgi:hypothetical protein